MAALESAAKQRILTINATSEERRNALAQHLTPKETARLAASMFAYSNSELTCLDMGCGTGMLSVALYERYGSLVQEIDCIEADPILAHICDEELNEIPHRIIVADALLKTPEKEYDRIILNPPYKKMANSDERQRLLPVKASNLYSAFLAVALSRLADKGECVAIIPRSWTNGDYFTPFRQWALGRFSLDALHVYGSRTEIFSDTNVLQETMIVKFSRRPQIDDIEVSVSNTKCSDVNKHKYRSSDLMVGDGREVRIAPGRGSLSETVASIGLCPSTGKVVDFRSKERVYTEYNEAVSDAENESDIFKLVYAGNFRSGQFTHPANIGKPQWFRADDKSSRAQIIQPGCYVLVKRFSSKEERRRVVAFPIETDIPIAFENHTSFIHSGTSRNIVPLPSLHFARGLSIWLNSTFIDDWFRDISGSTQVNAKDIKAMPCPSTDQIQSYGLCWKPNMPQEDIDLLVRSSI